MSLGKKEKGSKRVPNLYGKVPEVDVGELNIPVKKKKKKNITGLPVKLSDWQG